MGAAHQKLAQPPKPPKYSASFEGLFWIDGGTHRIPAKLYQYNSPSDDRPYWTILYCPTHDEDLGAVSSKLNVYKEVFKVDILSFDYCGFGLHQCSTKLTEAIYSDTLHSVFNWLRVDRNVPEQQIVLMGKGLGTGPILELIFNLQPKHKLKKRTNSPNTDTEEKEVGAIILQSPMLSLNSIAVENFEGDSIPRHDIFVNSKKISYIESPILIAHGTEDRFIPFSSFQKFKKPCAKKNNVVFYEIPGKGHHGLDYDDDFLQYMTEFLHSLMPANLRPAHLSPQPKKKTGGYLSPEEMLKTSWLADLELEHLASQFIMGGYLDLTMMSELNVDVLESLGITNREEQSKILDDLLGKKLVVIK